MNLLEKYLNNTTTILSETRYLDLEKTLTKYGDKDQFEKEIKERGEICSIPLIDTFNYEAMEQSLLHNTYDFFVSKKVKLANTMDEFIKITNDKIKVYGYQVHHGVASEDDYKFKNFLQLRCALSMNFISLFLDDFFFYYQPKEDESHYIRRSLTSEELKILKYFLSELHEHALHEAPVEDWPLHPMIVYFEGKILKPIFKSFDSALEMFLKLTVNGMTRFDVQDYHSNHIRYRSKHKIHSFEILWNSLKEYEPESAIKLMTMITADFTSFVLFLSQFKYTR
jgi:hypothetical protein